MKSDLNHKVLPDKTSFAKVARSGITTKTPMRRTISRLAAYSIAALLAGLITAPAQADGIKKVALKTSKSKAAADTNANGEPNILSSAALVFDQETGQPIYAKNADNAMPIASITKLMTAMIVLDAKLNMDEPIVIDKSDIDTLKNSHSRLPVGTAFRREDLMRLALMASDNRAAAALGRTYPGGTTAAVEAMNAKARALGLQHATFVDPTGLAPGNMASPADLALMVSAASKYEPIREFSTTASLNVTLPNSKRPMGFSNTNALVRASGWEIGLSKTGYINEAGKCLVMQAMIASRPVVIVLLDSWGKLTRIGDANRIKKWIEKNNVAALSAKSS
jgi:D-alanyl-D-alanine endopeptidase (penicillin-binding protein 7)